MAILSIVKGSLSDLFRGGSKIVAIHQSSSKGKDETSLSCFAPGFEINPANGENLVLTKIGNSNSFVVSIGGTNQNIAPDTERGERKIYSVSEDGTEIKASIKLKNNGDIEIVTLDDNANITISNALGEFSLKSDGQFKANGFTVDP